MGRGVCVRKLWSSAVRLAESKLSEVRSIKIVREPDIDKVNVKSPSRLTRLISTGKYCRLLGNNER